MGLEELERHTAAFDVYLKAAEIAKERERPISRHKKKMDSESSSDDGISDDDKYEKSADIISDDEDDDEEEGAGFFITEVAGDKGEMKKKGGRRRGGVAVDEEGDVVKFDENDEKGEEPIQYDHIKNPATEVCRLVKKKITFQLFNNIYSY